MPAIRITDSNAHALTVDAKDIVASLGNHALKSWWHVGAEAKTGEWMISGDDTTVLEDAMATGQRIRGRDLVVMLDAVQQTIWGQFDAHDARQGGAPWVTIVAVDSSWFDVLSDDPSVLRRVAKSFTAVEFL